MRIGIPDQRLSGEREIRTEGETSRYICQEPRRTIVSRENEQPVRKEEREKKREREAEREST